MPSYSQDEIITRNETLTTNGLRPEAQAVIITVGFDPPKLNEGVEKAATLIAARSQKTAAASAKRKATNAENSARKAARREITSLTKTCRTLFAGNIPVLVHLGLQPTYRTVTDPETGETKKVAVRPLQGTAEIISQWTTLSTNAQRLEPADQATLTAAGWGAARLAAVSALVEAYSLADIAQQKAIHQAGKAAKALRAAYDDLVRWYTRARQLCLIAIKDADPTNSQNLIELLGLQATSRRGPRSKKSDGA